MLALAFRCSSFETDSDWRIHFEVVPRNSFGEDEAHEAEGEAGTRGTRAKAGTWTRAKAGTEKRVKAGTEKRVKAGKEKRAKAGTEK